MSYFSGFGSLHAGGAATGGTPSKSSTHSTPNSNRDRSTHSLDASSHALFAYEGGSGRLVGDKSDRTVDSSTHAGEVNSYHLK